MIRKGIFCSLLGLGIVLVGCNIPTGGNNSRETSEEDIQPPNELLQPKPKRIQHKYGGYSGIVGTVGSDWVELRTGWEGVIEEGKKPTWDNTKTKRLTASGTRPGGDPNGDGKRMTYRLSDLKVGDVVDIETGVSRDGEEWTTEIKIVRRPGGKIPPVPGEGFPGLENTHLRYQAEQDWEEKGIPIPKKYLNKDGRYPWTNPPYPPEAPMPREAKPAKP
jgi:hypothetical protein